MEHKKPSLSHFSPVLPVKDLNTTIEWYSSLGFELSFKWGEPGSYAIMARDNLKMHFCLQEDDYQPSKTHTHLYFFVYDVDELYNEFISNGLKPSLPMTHEYGMRDFDLIDLNGYRLCFGKG